MAEKIRLKGRGLLVGAVPLSYLTFAVRTMLVFSLSLLPVAYKSVLMPHLFEWLGDKTRYVSLGFSFILIALIYMSYMALKVGSDRYMLKKAENVHADTKDIFFYFKPKSLIALFGFSFRLFIVKFIILLFFNLPTIFCAFLIAYLSKATFSAAVTVTLSFGCFAFLLNALNYYFKITSSMFLMKYYFIKGEFLNFKHLMASSQNAMKGRSLEIRKIKKSFIGWFVSCLFLLPIGYVWGYYNQTLAAYAQEIMKLQ